LKEIEVKIILSKKAFSYVAAKMWSFDLVLSKIILNGASV
jgi:hypothetical protein